jgi:hypothetical protein
LQKKIIPEYEKYMKDSVNSKWAKFMEKSRAIIIKNYSTIYNEDNLVSNIILQRSFIQETLNKITDEFSKINYLKIPL